MSLQLAKSNILIAPHVTEKAVRNSAREGSRVYTFKVHPSANKQEIAKAVQAVYGVNPVRVNVLKQEGKKVNRRGKGKGEKSGYKKAMVFLKEGETIEFV